jgi:hypothetical protein
MDTLNKKANNNLKLLLDLNHDDNLNSKRGELLLQDDFVQVDNVSEIEYAIYFTFTELFSTNQNIFYNTELLDLLDTCIENIFDNKQLNELIENDEQFKNIIDNIDDKLLTLKDSYYYNSPFFKMLKYINNKYESIKNIMDENNEYIKKMLIVSSDKYSYLPNVNEKVNLETGEENPNLIYSDDDLDDEKECDTEDENENEELLKQE